jgi:NADP-dependent 3-hydroxy acid dehydrogenase YdfG
MKSTNSANWILVTGTTGIGRAATFTLAENGYRVLAAVRKQEDIESLLAEAGTRRVVGYVEPIILDVTDAGQIEAAIEIVRVRIAAGGRLHAIINNAGAQWAGPIETMPLTEWRSRFDVTFFVRLLLPSSSFRNFAPRADESSTLRILLGSIPRCKASECVDTVNAK